MGVEIDLMKNYPKAKRDLASRGQEKTEEDRRIARQFGKEFFDGDRRTGYGGYSYNPRFWTPVIPSFKERYHLTPESRVLDVGCGKGFMLYDLQKSIPGIKIGGVDISQYAIENGMEDVKPFLKVGNVIDLPYEDNSFDLVISVTTVHNLDRQECVTALREIERVSAKNSFITVDAYHDDEERDRMEKWNLTAKTVLHVDDWRALFAEAGYTGDYYWFIP